MISQVRGPVWKCNTYRSAFDQEDVPEFMKNSIISVAFEALPLTKLKCACIKSGMMIDEPVMALFKWPPVICEHGFSVLFCIKTDINIERSPTREVVQRPHREA